jgi:hypothetical protein
MALASTIPARAVLLGLPDLAMAVYFAACLRR